MAWVAVDKDGTEGIYAERPCRLGSGWYYLFNTDLPKGTIKKLIGKDLTWEDNPVKLK